MQKEKDAEVFGSKGLNDVSRSEAGVASKAAEMGEVEPSGVEAANLMAYPFTPEQQSLLSNMTNDQQCAFLAAWHYNLSQQQEIANWMYMEAWSKQQWSWDGYNDSNQQWKASGRRPKRGGQGDTMQDAQDGETQEQQEQCDALSQRIEAGEKEAVKEALSMMRGKVFEYSRRKYACRMVQKVIANASFAQQKEIAAGLQGKVRMAANHMHANYVIQEFIIHCPASLTVFVAKELHGHAAKMAWHRSGCRVMLRLLEAVDKDKNFGKDTIALMNELLEDELRGHLMHEYAHHVIAKILEKGEPDQKVLVLDCFKRDLLAFATQKSSCYVLEFAVSQDLDFEDDDDELALQKQDEILESLVMDKKPKGPEPLLVAMALNPSGSNVVRAMINRDDEYATKAMALLYAHEGMLQTGGKPGSRILKEMHLKQRSTGA